MGTSPAVDPALFSDLGAGRRWGGHADHCAAGRRIGRNDGAVADDHVVFSMMLGTHAGVRSE